MKIKFLLNPYKLPLVLMFILGPLLSAKLQAQTWGSDQLLSEWWQDPATPGNGIHPSGNNNPFYSSTLVTTMPSVMSGGSGVTYSGLVSPSESYTYHQLGGVNACSPAEAQTNNEYFTATATISPSVRTLRVSRLVYTTFQGDGVISTNYQVSFAARDVTAAGPLVFAITGNAADVSGGTYIVNSTNAGWNFITLIPGHTYEFRWYINKPPGQCGASTFKKMDNPEIDVQMVDLAVISGTVFNDFDGVANGVGNQSGAQVSGLNAVLVDTSGNVVATTAVNSTNGTYSFPGVDPLAASSTFKVLLTTANPTVGQTAPATATLPAGWLSTGENVGTGTGNDGTPDAISASFSPAGNTTVNFGINQPPTATNDLLSNQAPGSAATVPNILGNDTDPNGGTLSADSLTLIAPSGATGITIDAQGDVTGFTVPGQGAWVLNSSTGAVTFTPQNGFTGDPTPINYRVNDAAGAGSNTATITIDYNLPVTISGTLYNDNNGPTGGPDGSPIPGTTITLYAANGTTVIATDTTDASGNYSFPGIVPGNYVVGVTPPAGFQNVSSTDATPTNGLTAVTVGSAAVPGVNFGVNEPPQAGSSTATSSTPPAGTVSIPVLPAGFSGTDPNGGIIDSLKITGFPTNSTSITIDGTTYYPNAGSIPPACTTCAVFPATGVTIPATHSGQPAVAIAVDPSGTTATTIIIPYTVIDNAHLQDPTPGSLTLPFDTPLPVEWLYFTAKASGSDVLLQWATAMEKNTNYFEAEYATDGSHFRKLGQVAATGNSAAVSNYSLQHSHAADLGVPVLQYRIRQVDRDGRFTYSEVRSVWLNTAGQSAVTVYPNPVTRGGSLTLMADKINDVQVSDATGHNVWSGQFRSESLVTIPIGQWASGTYLIHINSSQVVKFVVK